MNKEWIQETNELLEEWEAQRESLHAEYEQIADELMDLEKRIEVGHDLISAYMKKHSATTVIHDNFKLGNLANKPYPEMLIEIAKQSPDGILTVEVITDILLKANIGIDRKTVRHNIGNTLLRFSKLGKHFVRIGRGQYRFTNHVQIKKAIEPRELKNIRDTKSTREPSGVRQAVRDLKEKNPQMSKADVLSRLLESGFDFRGKKPASAVNFSWAYWGYSKEGKQQKLPIPAPKTATAQPKFFQK